MNTRSTTPIMARALIFAALALSASTAACTFDDDDNNAGGGDDAQPNNAVDAGNDDPADDAGESGDEDVSEEDAADDAGQEPDAQDPDACPDLNCQIPADACSDDALFIVRTSGEVSKNGCSCVFSNLVESFESCEDTLEGSRCFESGEQPQCVNLCPEDCPSEDACLDDNTALVYSAKECDPLDGVCPNPEQITCAGNERCVNGACRQDCATNDDCQDNVTCTTDGSAILTLTQGQCIAGGCQYSEDRLDCGDGFQCVDLTCQQSCDVDDDCPVIRGCNEDNTAVNVEQASCINNTCNYGGPVPEFCSANTACTLENGEAECR